MEEFVSFVTQNTLEIIISVVGGIILYFILKGIEQGIKSSGYSIKKFDKIKVEIINPKENDKVERNFICQGRVTCDDRQILWVFFEISNKYWAKAKIDIMPDKTFTASVSEGGDPTDGKFKVAVYAVSRKANSDIEDWIQAGKNNGTQKYKGTYECSKVNVTLNR
jgi:hypothetical protein